MSVLHEIDERLEIPPMDRFSLYAFLGLVRVMEPVTEELMLERAQASLEEDEHDSPHERPWFVSMHASQFPGTPETACERALAYRMMNFPTAAGVVPPWVQTTGVIGKAGEMDIVDAWFRGGRLLSVPETEGSHQLGFVDPEHWMTASTDLPILPKGWRRPHIVEVKGKADSVLDEMIEGRLLQLPDGKIEKVGRGPDASHINQLKATIGKAHDFDWGEVVVCKHSWRILGSQLHERLGVPGGIVYGTDAYHRCPEHGYGCQLAFELEPPTTGELYYWSRSWPRKTKSFYYEHDPVFMARGLEVLASTKQHFINDTIPPRPEHFQWSVGACQRCNHKPFCRLDFGLPPRARKPRPDMVRTKLTESAGVDHARELRPNYDSIAVRQRVFDEWGQDG